MLNELLEMLNTVGQVVDTPWAAVRTGIRDRDIGSAMNSILDVEARATGREMLESMGMLDANTPGLDWGDVAGFGAEVIPDMLLPGAGAYKILKMLRPAEEAATIGRGFLDAIDKAVPTPSVPAAIPESELDRLLASNPIIESAESMLPALPAPTVDAPAYYSRLRNAIDALPGENFKSQSVMNQLRRFAPEGFSQEEVEWSKLGELLGQGPMVTKAQMLGHMDEMLPTYSPSAVTTRGGGRYKQYATGAGPYEETLLQLPGEAQHSVPSHWKEPNVLTHLRTELVRRPGGKTGGRSKTLLANEIQSDWHQAGKKRGYRDDSEVIGRSAGLDRAAEEAAARASEGMYAIAHKLQPFDNLGFDNSFEAMKAIRDHDDWLRRWDVSDMPADLVSELEAWRETAKQARRLTVEANELAKMPRGIPDAPFKDDWPLLGLKELIRQGVDKGADEVAWLPGKQIQGLVGGQLSGQEKFYDTDLVNIANKYIKNRGWDTAVNVGDLPTIRPTGKGWLTDDFSPAPAFRIPITPAMRRDIRERGQPLMSILPILAALGLSQSDA